MNMKEAERIARECEGSVRDVTHPGESEQQILVVIPFVSGAEIVLSKKGWTVYSNRLDIIAQSER